MKFSLTAYLLLSSFAWSQEISKPPIDGDAVVATLNGQKMTAREFERIVAVLDPQLRQLAEKNPREFLDQWAMFQVLLADAEKAQMETRSPYKEQLAEARRKVLIQALIDERTKAVAPSAEEQKKLFEANHDRYFQARVKV